jgi:integrase
MFVAQGKSLAVAAGIIGVQTRTLVNCRRNYRELWKETLEEAIVSAEEVEGDFSTMLLAEFLATTYLPSRMGMSPKSAEQLAVTTRLYNPPLRDLNELELSRMLSSYSQDHSPSTVNSKRRQILTLWDAAAVQGLCRPPFRKRVPRAREYRRTPLAWTKTEIEKLVTHCRRLSGQFGPIPQSMFWSSLVLFLWDTGARIGSTLAIRSTDCNLAERYVLLRAEDSKTGMDRLHRFSEMTAAAISGHYDRRRRLIWPWECHRRTLFKYFRWIVEDTGLQSESTMGLFHKLRRTNLSYTAAGGGIGLAQEQAGHSSPGLTQRHYIDPRIAHQRSSIDVLPELDLPEEEATP